MTNLYMAEDFICKSCGHIWDDLVLREERDNPQACPECKVEAGVRSIVTPRGITNVSFVDGQRARIDPGWAKAKRQKEMRKQAYEAESKGNYAESAAIKKEIPKQD